MRSCFWYKWQLVKSLGINQGIACFMDIYRQIPNTDALQIIDVYTKICISRKKTLGLNVAYISHKNKQLYTPIESQNKHNNVHLPNLTFNLCLPAVHLLLFVLWPWPLTYLHDLDPSVWPWPLTYLFDDLLSFLVVTAFLKTECVHPLQIAVNKRSEDKNVTQFRRSLVCIPEWPLGHS